jgi:2-pyrone-4,6-dicarboxylate lactonase
MTAQCQMPDLAPRAPKFAVPPNACDTHAHLFEPGPGYPLKAKRAYEPPAVTIEHYRQMLAALGMTRAVIVHSAVYQDHQLTIDALQAAGGRWRAIAVADPQMSERDIAALDAAGFRGVRFNPYNNPAVGLAGMEELVARIQPFGWHVQLHLNAKDLVELEPRLRRLPVDVVIDHIGHMPLAEGLANAGFQRMLAMLREEKCWVKVSAPMRFEDAKPPYPRVTPFAQAVIAAGPTRVLWGSDWPHVIFDGYMPNDGELLDLLSQWAPDERVRNAILVDNPAKLYGFAA